jgi:hypothetical protein
MVGRRLKVEGGGDTETRMASQFSLQPRHCPYINSLTSPREHLPPTLPTQEIRDIPAPLASREHELETDAPEHLPPRDLLEV